MRVSCLVPLAFATTFVAAACGDSEEDSPPPRAPAAAQSARPAAGRPVKATGKSALTTYRHLEDLMTADEQAAGVRHQFRESDFMQDLDGDNRDPFRSFILSSGILDTRSSVAVQATDMCTAKQMVATNYSIRDLKLVGIVSRGLRRYALMQDTANLGQIVTRGDCVGKEKARVKEIGAGYVTLEVMPEAGSAGVPRVAEERSIPLYPEELPMSRGDSGEDDAPVPVVAPQPVAPAAAGAAVAPASPAPAMPAPDKIPPAPGK